MFDDGGETAVRDDSIWSIGCTDTYPYINERVAIVTLAHRFIVYIWIYVSRFANALMEAVYQNLTTMVCDTKSEASGCTDTIRSRVDWTKKPLVSTDTRETRNRRVCTPIHMFGDTPIFKFNGSNLWKPDNDTISVASDARAGFLHLSIRQKHKHAS